MGVDRVIVVDIGTPLKSASELNSVLDIMDQTTTLLTRTNTERQLATLTDADLLLQPALGDMGFSSFAETQQAIDAGAQSLSEAQGVLAFVAPPGSDAGGNLASSRPQRQAIIHAVEVDNSGKVADEVVLSMIRQEVGEPLNLARLQTDMGTIYGTDYFSRVTYEVVHDQGHNTLLVHTAGRRTGTDYLRLGLNLVDDFEGDSQYNLGASFRVNGLNPLGAEWLTRLQVGSDQELYTEFYQPLDYGSRYFVAPFIDADSRNLEVIDDNDPIVAYRQKRYGAGINIGRQIANNGEVRFGLSRYRGNSRVRIGDPDLPDVDFDEAFYSIEVDRDTLDNVNFPRSGDEAKFSWRQSEPALGADERYQQIEFKANKAFGFGPNSWQVGGFIGRTDSDVNVAQSSFVLGGPGWFSGFRQDALAGQNYQLGRLVYYRRLTPSYFNAFSLPLYLGASLEYGRVYNRDDTDFDTGYFTGGSLLLGMDTLVGPLFFGLGANEEGHEALYMKLGQTF